MDILVNEDSKLLIREQSHYLRFSCCMYMLALILYLMMHHALFLYPLVKELHLCILCIRVLLWPILFVVYIQLVTYYDFAIFGIPLSAECWHSSLALLHNLIATKLLGIHSWS